MAAQRLSRLQRRILCYVYEAEASSDWHTWPSHVEVVRALGGNKGTLSVSIRNLEAKGLLKVYRTRGGYADSLWLTPEGRNRGPFFEKSLD